MVNDSKMGNPNTGEIYEGVLRDSGDVPLTNAQAELLKTLSLSERLSALQDLKKQFEKESEKDSDVDDEC